MMLAALALLVAALLLPPAASAQRDRADVIRVPFPKDDGSLTPYTFALGYPLMTLVYDTLMWRGESGTPRPWLARSVTREGDGLTVRIRLRSGARWHDGVPVTAGDVAFTFAYVAARPHPRFTPQVRDVEDVQIAGPRELLVRLRHPSLGFEDQPLSDMPILPRHLWEDLSSDRLAPVGPAIGSGPYRLVEHERGRRYVFRANRGYFRGPPRVDRIEVPIIRRQDPTFEALRRGEVDAIAFGLTSSGARELTGFNVRAGRGASYLGTVLMLNTRIPPFDRGQVRRAIAGALDLTTITRALADLPAEQVAIPAEQGYIHPASEWSAQRDLHRLQPDSARVVLAEQGLPTIRVLAPANDALRREAGRQVVLALRRAGVRSELRELSPARLARAVGQDGSVPRFQAAVWSAPALASFDPAFLTALFGGESPLDYSGYDSPEFDRLAAAVSAATDLAARRRAVAAELRLLARDAPVVPLFFADGFFAFRPRSYAGWRFMHGSGIFDKRSFFAGPREAGVRPPIGDPLDRTDGGGGSGYLLAAAGLIGLLLLAALVRALAGVAVRR
jgi:peptide/nickel transport system substrate-binding protein